VSPAAIYLGQGPSTPERKMSEIDKLYAVADDDEAATLDHLRNKAGLTWECQDKGGFSHWTNSTASKTCEQCGRKRTSK
jgi:hypothetical protein